MSDLLALADDIERAAEGSRELDLAVHLALFPNGEIARWVKYPRGLSGREGYSWDISGSAIIFEKRTADGRCPHNGGVTLPPVTTSLDAALSLVPEGWRWSVEGPDRDNFGDPIRPCAYVDDFKQHTEARFSATAVLALCAASLRAIHQGRSK